MVLMTSQEYFDPSALHSRADHTLRAFINTSKTVASKITSFQCSSAMSPQRRCELIEEIHQYEHTAINLFRLYQLILHQL